MFGSRLYLDWDGVFNAGKPRFDDVAEIGFKNKLAPGLFEVITVTYSPTMLTAVDNMRKSHNAEIVWLSTWNENLAILRLLDKLGTLNGGRVINPVIDRVTDTNRAWTRWKATGLIADQKHDATPFIWVDDEAHKFHKKDVDAATGDTPKLFITPRSYWGLTTELLNDMDAFLSLQH